MSFIFENDLIFGLIFGVSVLVCSYLWIDKIIDFLYRRSLGSRENVIELMDKMFVDTDKKKTTMAMLLISFGVGSIVFLALWPNVIFGFIVGSIVTVVGWSLPEKLMQSLWEKRCNRIVGQMVDAMTIMANGVKSGLSVPNSLDRVIENMNGPIIQEFQLIQNKLRLGRSISEAMNELGERIPRPDILMFVTSINILSETGGNLSETFATISFTIRERQKIQKKIEALTASSLMQARIITLVPFVVLGVSFMMTPEMIMPLFTNPLGWIALGMVLALQIIGSVVMKKMVTIKV